MLQRIAGAAKNADTANTAAVITVSSNPGATFTLDRVKLVA